MGIWCNSSKNVIFIEFKTEKKMEGDGDKWDTLYLMEN